jgi:hypothetical protein
VFLLFIEKIAQLLMHPISSPPCWDCDLSFYPQVPHFVWYSFSNPLFEETSFLMYPQNQYPVTALGK